MECAKPASFGRSQSRCAASLAGNACTEFGQGAPEQFIGNIAKASRDFADLRFRERQHGRRDDGLRQILLADFHFRDRAKAQPTVRRLDDLARSHLGFERKSAGAEDHEGRTFGDFLHPARIGASLSRLNAAFRPADFKRRGALGQSLAHNLPPFRENGRRGEATLAQSGLDHLRHKGREPVDTRSLAERLGFVGLMRHRLAFPVEMTGERVTARLGSVIAPLQDEAMLETSPATVKGPSDRTALLLAWYDREGRDLPWRVKEGRADPYRVWLSEIMLQQTTVEAVKPYFAKFLALWPNVHALAAADDQAVLTAWAGLGYYARARNLMACVRVVAREFGGKFPQTEAVLRALPGIGAYTAAAIAAIAFGERAIVIDGNIERVITRLEAIDTPLPRAKTEIRSVLETLVPAERAGDFAQALMDLGATICTPKSPSCLLCPLAHGCVARARGEATNFPVKPPKKGKKARHSLAFVALDGQGRILLRSRPARGLLAGMSEVPNTPWESEPGALASAPLSGPWQKLNQPVIHVFTHIELRVEIAVRRLDGLVAAPDGMRWVAVSKLDGEPLPTLFRKVIEAGLRALK